MAKSDSLLLALSMPCVKSVVSKPSLTANCAIVLAILCSYLSTMLLIHLVRLVASLQKPLSFCLLVPALLLQLMVDKDNRTD